MSVGMLASQQESIINSATDMVAEQVKVTCGTERSWTTRLARKSVIKLLSGLQGGRLILDDECERHVLGHGDADGLSALLVVNSPSFYRRVATEGSLGAAESYLRGEWDCDDLTSLFRIISRNLDRSTLGVLRSGFVSRAVARAGHWLSRNTRAGSRRNIEAHYDLGNDFFELFLDPSMMYSSAMFERPDMTLEEAQISRLDHICRSLQLTSSDHVVEIGTGWGGFAHHAAMNFGCRVTTTTVSKEQFDYASQRVAAAGLSDRVTVLLQDYRDLNGSYDKLVSLEMVEAVGPQFYDTYFQKCAGLLKPGGRMLLQAIVMPEQRYDQYLKSVDFIQKFIFPGGSLPSVSALQDAVTRTSDLRLVRMEDFADGYARTLREWRSRFHDQLQAVRELGYSDRFIRMWDYYLTYCEAAFEERAVGVVQAVWGA